MSRVAVYYRVSTDEQDFASQEHAVAEWMKTRGININESMVFQDAATSGSKDNRPGFQALRDAVDAGEVKTVVVYALDRLSRKATTALRVLLDWMQRGVEFFSVTQPILQLGSENPIRLTIVALFSELAEIERKQIVGRVKAGLAAAQKRGVKLGAKTKFDEGKVAEVIKLRRRGSTFSQIATLTKISKTRVHELVKEAGGCAGIDTE